MIGVVCALLLIPCVAGFVAPCNTQPGLSALRPSAPVQLRGGRVGVSMSQRIETFLLQGDGSGSVLRTALEDVAGPGHPDGELDCLVLFSLGAKHECLLDAATASAIRCPVYLSETYGILGFDRDLGKNIELMEKGRGTEYGCCGGAGGQGTVVVAFRGGGMQVDTTGGQVPEDATSVLIISDDSSPGLPKMPCTMYGGITKANFQLREGKFEQVSNLFFASITPNPHPVAIATVENDIADAVEDLKAKIPTSHHASGVVGLFPCFTRGINAFNRDNVEPDAVSDKLGPSCRIFGMFVHGELGPPAGTGVFADAGAKSVQVVFFPFAVCKWMAPVTPRPRLFAPVH